MKRILIIEDQTEAKEVLLKEYCEENDQVDVAESGIEAFFYIHQNEYDTVIVSNDLSDLNGIWIIQYLKEKQKNDLILTSMFNHENLEKKASRMKIKFFKKTVKKNHRLTKI